MTEKKYDIFISYRRKDTGDKAEHLKDLLDKTGFENRVSFDRENLTGLFDVELARRIDHCKDFLLVIGPNSFNYDEDDFTPEQVELYNQLGSCSQADFKKKIIEMGPNAHLDFMRIEIARALHREGLNLIPIVPQSSDSFNFSKIKLPDDIADIKRHEAVFFSDNPDALFKDVIPKIVPRLKSKPKHPLRKALIPIGAIVLIGVITLVGITSHRNRVAKEKEALEAKCIAIFDEKGIKLSCGQEINCDKDITVGQLQALVSILENMAEVEGGSFMQGAAPNPDGSYDDLVCQRQETPQVTQKVPTFFINEYEVSVAEWSGIMGLKHDEETASMPMTDVSFEDCQKFVERLSNLSGLNFVLPTETEWEFAARGGTEPDSTRFAGSDNPDEVAWYAGNSGNRAHVRNDIKGGLDCNALNLYDMSGNVCEWCDTPFRPYNPDIPTPDPNAMVVRGGYYGSEPYELTVYHRDPMNRNTPAANIGLRLAIRND